MTETFLKQQPEIGGPPSKPFTMQRRLDDPQRRLNPIDSYPQVAAPTGNSRFSDIGDNVMPAGMPFPLPGGYQLNQSGGHHGAVPNTLGHHGVSLSATGPSGPVPISRGPPQSLHTQTVPQHPANQPLTGGSITGGQQQQQQQQFQRLKVEDALSYLDQVKLQFGNQPQVYNDFLDIMKEFKSQTIDTPGVINRVSNLFKGHPDLIVGFNTFLPPGYKIEVQCETINVHQPGQQVMSIAALAQSQAVASSNRQHKQGLHIWEQALASQQQKVSAIPHPTLSTSSASPADHRSYHQSPRQDTSTLTAAAAAAAMVQQPQAQQPQSQQHQQQTQQQQQQQQQQGQPVEFNHAINYVNKIKNRFQGQPDIYKQFLEILHTYQKEQRLTRDGLTVGPSKPLTESEVYQQVANLFKHQEDLLAEFGQFLPDANGSSSYSVASFADSALGVRNDHSSTVKKPGGYSSGKTQTSKTGSGVKRPSGNNTSSSISSFQPPAKQKKGVPKDFSLADASKTGSLTEYAFFDKVRKALRHQEVYDNFLRSIILFNQDIVTKSELITLVGFFLTKFPDLYREFKDLLGMNDQSGGMEPVPHNAATKERLTGDLAMEIDFNTCKRYGASYRGIPTKYVPPKCSGRTALCKEVLNDTWVSFPTWSEDSSFVTSRKTQYEENIYKCEDERFELDYVIESNYSTIKSLEAVLKKMTRMAQEDGSKHKLDNSLGGTSESINRNSIQRIYGEKAHDIIEGLKKNPVIAVPLVLRRLKAKDEEWREAQKQFNKLWKEQNEKFYLKSLDHQGANFKQHDIKAIRGKSLLNQIETVYDERADYEENAPQGPMLSHTYENRALIEDSARLIIHHVKRQTGIDKETKCRIKQLIKQFVPDLFFAPRGELSDDDGDMGEDLDQEEEESISVSNLRGGRGERLNGGGGGGGGVKKEGNDVKTEVKDTTTANVKMELDVDNDERDKKDDNGSFASVGDNENYTLMMCNSTWYIFLRLHHILCSRLLKVYNLTQKFIQEDALTKNERKDSVALALRLRTPLEVEVQDYYSYFLDMVMAVLDGNLESSQYEDTMREMYGIEAYQLFTMDKVVQNMVRQVQHIVIDELPYRLTKLYDEQRVKGGAGGRSATRHQRATLEQTYLRQAEAILGDESPFRVVIHSRTGCMEMDMLDPPMDNPDSVKEASAWSTYVTDYTTGTKKNEEFAYRVASNKPIYLMRNKRKNSEWILFKKNQETAMKEEEEDEDDRKMDVDDYDDEDEREKAKKLDKTKVKSEKEDGSDVKVKEELEGESDKDGEEEQESKGGAGSSDSSGPAKDCGMEDGRDAHDNDKDDDESRVPPPPPPREDDDEDEDKGGERYSDDGGLGDDEDDDEKVMESSVSKRKKLGPSISSDGGSRRIHTMVDTTSVRFQHNNAGAHMFVIKTGQVSFRPHRVARTKACHKSVTQRKFQRLNTWHKSWLAQHVVTTQTESCKRWMLGMASDTQSNRTSSVPIEAFDVTPYRIYTKYRVDWLRNNCQSSPTPHNNGAD